MADRSFNPSPQQTDFISWCKNGAGNAILQAVAGAGKTTTILQACAVTANGSVQIAAFNKRIADEIKLKVAAMGMNGRVSADTFHALGFRAWRNIASPKLKVDGNKLHQIADENTPQYLKSFAVKLVSLAKQQGIGLRHLSIRNKLLYNEIIDHHGLVELLSKNGEIEVTDELVEEGIEAAINMLLESNKRIHYVIDFDDMLYAPLLENVRIKQSNWVFVDEAQDSNTVRRMFVRKMMNLDSRAVFVGDERQAINGFAGADNESMQTIKKDFNCIELPLTVTYRCPKLVVSQAQILVSYIEAHDTAPEGVVDNISFEDFTKTKFNATDAILCRNTAPLVSVAYSLIKQGIGCRVEGKDIGAGLLALANRWKIRDLSRLLDKLEEFAEKRIDKMMSEGKEVAAANFSDRVDSLKVIIEMLPPGSDINTLQQTITTMFGDSTEKYAKQLLTLSTVHKSKGREWETVFLLGREQFMPSRYARQEWQKIQEDNLIYVAITRTQHRLVYVNNVPQITKGKRTT